MDRVPQVRTNGKSDIIGCVTLLLAKSNLLQTPSFLFCSSSHQEECRMPETTAYQSDFLDDQLIINYNDVCIYGRDFRLLRTTGAWLNDTILHYQLVRLQEQYSPNQTILFLDPIVVSFFMHQCEDLDELTEFWNGCNNGFSGTHRIVFPIVDTMSDHQNWYARTGTHWSLLVLDVHDSSLHGYHFDSISQSGNFSCAQQVANKLQALFRVKTTHSKPEATSSTAVAIHECRVPTQNNGYDCGIHVLIAAEMIALQPHHFKIESSMEHHFSKAISMWMGKQSDTSMERCCDFMRQQIASDILEQVTPPS
jgi:Ulp1 family protease